MSKNERELTSTRHSPELRTEARNLLSSMGMKSIAITKFLDDGDPSHLRRKDNFKNDVAMSAKSAESFIRANCSSSNPYIVKCGKAMKAIIDKKKDTTKHYKTALAEQRQPDDEVEVEVIRPSSPS